MPLVEQIIQKLGAETVADLTLVDEDMAKEAVQDLKLIPRKKAMEVLLKVSANAPLPPTPALSALRPAAALLLPPPPPLYMRFIV